MNEIEQCAVRHVHEDVVEDVLAHVPGPEVLERLAELYKILGDPTRIRMLHALSVAELCVCDLTAILQLNQSAVSHQLRLLKGARLVRTRRQGRTVFYHLDDDHVKELYELGMEHVLEEAHG